MRILTCALGALVLCAAPAAMAQHNEAQHNEAQHNEARRNEAPRQPSLFISPMGEAFRANSSGARGVDLWFTEADTNYDMRISHDEFIANANAFFAQVDTNHDGALTSLEDTEYWRRTAPEVVSGPAGGEPIGNTNGPPQRNQHDNGGYTVTRESDVSIRGPHRGGPGERPVGAQAYGLLGDAEPIMSCDSNFDRRVTLEEFDACAERRFAQLDTNHDGFITPDEVNQARSTSSDILQVRR